MERSHKYFTGLLEERLKNLQHLVDSGLVENFKQPPKDQTVAALMRAYSEASKSKKNGKGKGKKGKKKKK